MCVCVRVENGENRIEDIPNADISEINALLDINKIK